MLCDVLVCFAGFRVAYCIGLCGYCIVSTILVILLTLIMSQYCALLTMECYFKVCLLYTFNNICYKSVTLCGALLTPTKQRIACFHAVYREFNRFRKWAIFRTLVRILLKYVLSCLCFMRLPVVRCVYHIGF